VIYCEGETADGDREIMSREIDALERN